MKTLYVIRHAKSSWSDPELSDFERPLNARGKRDAPRMGERLKERGVTPQCIVSSPAKRAFSTARRICKVLGYKKDDIKKDRRLYHADEETTLSVIKETRSKHDVLMIFGHNPGLTDFVNALASDEPYVDIPNIPTCGIVAFQFDIKDWSEVTWGSGRILFFDYPKNAGKSE